MVAGCANQSVLSNCVGKIPLAHFVSAWHSLSPNGQVSKVSTKSPQTASSVNIYRMIHFHLQSIMMGEPLESNCIHFGPPGDHFELNFSIVADVVRHRTHVFD